jgi:hypothetical protein
MGIVPHPKSQRSLSGTVPIFSHIRAKSIGENSEDTLKIAGELDPARKPPALATPTIAEGPAVKKSTDATRSVSLPPASPDYIASHLGQADVGVAAAAGVATTGTIGAASGAANAAAEEEWNAISQREQIENPLAAQIQDFIYELNPYLQDALVKFKEPLIEDLQEVEAPEKGYYYPFFCRLVGLCIKGILESKWGNRIEIFLYASGQQSHYYLIVSIEGRDYYLGFTEGQFFYKSVGELPSAASREGPWENFEPFVKHYRETGFDRPIFSSDIQRIYAAIGIVTPKNVQATISGQDEYAIRHLLDLLPEEYRFADSFAAATSAASAAGAAATGTIGAASGGANAAAEYKAALNEAIGRLKDIISSMDIPLKLTLDASDLHDQFYSWFRDELDLPGIFSQLSEDERPTLEVALVDSHPDDDSLSESMDASNWVSNLNYDFNSGNGGMNGVRVPIRIGWLCHSGISASGTNNFQGGIWHSVDSWPKGWEGAITMDLDFFIPEEFTLDTNGSEHPYMINDIKGFFEGLVQNEVGILALHIDRGCMDVKYLPSVLSCLADMFEQYKEPLVRFRQRALRSAQGQVFARFCAGEIAGNASGLNVASQPVNAQSVGTSGEANNENLKTSDVEARRIHFYPVKNGFTLTGPDANEAEMELEMQALADRLKRDAAAKLEDEQKGFRARAIDEALGKANVIKALQELKEKWGLSHLFGTVPIFPRNAFAIVIGGEQETRKERLAELEGCDFDGVAEGQDQKEAKEQLKGKLEREGCSLNENDFILIIDINENHITSNLRLPNLQPVSLSDGSDIYGPISVYLKSVYDSV